MKIHRRVRCVETWKDIAGFDGMYQVSNLGNVRSFRFWRQRGESSRGTPSALRPKIGKYGHRAVPLFKDGVVTNVSLGKLMLLTFEGPSTDPDKKWALHRDGNTSNNLLSNFYWGTNSENQMDRVKHRTSNRGEANGHSKLLVKDVVNIKRRIAKGETNKSIAASYPHVDPSVVSAIRIGRIWGHLRDIRNAPEVEALS